MHFPTRGDRRIDETRKSKRDDPWETREEGGLTFNLFNLVVRLILKKTSLPSIVV